MLSDYEDLLFLLPPVPGTKIDWWHRPSVPVPTYFHSSWISVTRFGKRAKWDLNPSLCRYRQGEGKTATLTRFTFGFNLAAVGFNQAFGNG